MPYPIETFAGPLGWVSLKDQIGWSPFGAVILTRMAWGHTTVWVTSLATDQTGHATVSVPITQSGAIRVVVLAGTATSAWGQAEMDLNVP